MTTSAIIMMLVAIIVVWGGLGVAIALLLRGGSPSQRQFQRDL